MSLYKSEQTDGSESFWKRLLSRPCKSILTTSPGTDTRPSGMLFCKGKLGHKGKHYDRGTSWAYGDEFFGGGRDEQG